MDLILQQGISSGYAWPIVTGAGAPADLTGYTARAQVRERESVTSTLLHTFAASVVGSSVVIRWTDAESLLWAWTSGFYDVLLINPSGVSTQIVSEGSVIVNRVVTARV